MASIRVVGIGSPFGDDQLGWRVASLLQDNVALQRYLGNKLDIQLSDRPGLTLLNAMRNIQTLYVVDAIKTTHSQIGLIHRIDNGLINAGKGFLSTHGFGLTQAIQLARVLQQLPQQMVIYGIEIGEIDYQVSLSQAIEATCQHLAWEIAQELLPVLRCAFSPSPTCEKKAGED